MNTSFQAMTDYLVVGAGISGATVANLLSLDLSNTVTVIDSRSVVGGNCYDYRDENGILIHKYGSHIFHTSYKQVWDYLNNFTSFNTYQHRVKALIEGNEVPIPFCFDTLYQVFPESVSKKLECKLLSKYEYGSIVPISEFLLQDDPDLLFLAHYIYNNVFKTYTEKQWGSNSENVDDIVTARVPVCISRDTRYFKDKYQGIPVCGYTELVRRMLDKPNIEVRLNCDFKGLSSLSKYEKIFFSGEIDKLMGYTLGKLSYRSERFEFEIYKKNYYQDVAVVNYPNNYDFTRIHEFKHYLDDQSEVTVISKEYPEAYEPGKNEPYYPIPSKANMDLYSQYLEIVKEAYPNMVMVGRLGCYKYYNMDEAIYQAMKAVSNQC